jgi:L-ribulose-5-phosphate 4-epimerase
MKNFTGKYEHIKQQAYEAMMKLPGLDLIVYAFPNVSSADRELGVFAIKGGDVPYQELSAKKMVIVDFDGNLVEGELLSAGAITHAALYKHWEGINGICHTYCPNASMWAQKQKNIPVSPGSFANQNISNIPCVVPLYDINETDHEYQTALRIIHSFSAKGLSYEEVEMVVLFNHAPFTWGKTAEQAVYNSVLLEKLAWMALNTEQIKTDSLV